MKLNEMNKSQFYTTRQEVEKWLKKMQVLNASINADLTVDVQGEVYLNARDFEYFPVKFGYVSGSFHCNSNESLRSLVGAPDEVREDFDCSDCGGIKSLEGAPKIVRGDFDCDYCYSLETLKGAPSLIGRKFSARRNKALKALECPNTIVTTNFSVSFCEALKSFNGAPLSIGGRFGSIDCGAKNYLYMLKIKGLDHITSHVINDRGSSLDDIFDKYLPEGDMFECQQELMDAGLEDYADL